MVSSSPVPNTRYFVVLGTNKWSPISIVHRSFVRPIAPLGASLQVMLWCPHLFIQRCLRLPFFHFRSTFTCSAFFGILYSVVKWFISTCIYLNFLYIWTLYVSGLCMYLDFVRVSTCIWLVCISTLYVSRLRMYLDFVCISTLYVSRLWTSLVSRLCMYLNFICILTLYVHVSRILQSAFY